MKRKHLPDLIIGIKGAGEMASAVAWRLFQANLRRVFMMEIAAPLAVRRQVSFCEAVHEGRKTVEGAEALLVSDAQGAREAWDAGRMALLVDPEWRAVKALRPNVVVDAILAKRNLGTTLGDAPLVIALGPGLEAARHAHLVVETNRGHNLGRLITSGWAEADTGVPGEIAGHAADRVLRAPASGIFRATRAIADLVQKDEPVGTVGEMEMLSSVGGVLRGLIRSGTLVDKGLKIGDIDPRGDASLCFTISDKGRAIAGSVLEAILRVYNR